MDGELYLKKNLGTVDRTIRILVGIILIAYPAMASWSPGWIPVLAAIGAVQIYAGSTRY